MYDTQCGAKLFRVTRETAPLFDRPFRAKWIFDVELLARMIVPARTGGERPAADAIYEYPLDRWQDVAGSRLKSHDFLVAATDLAAIHWRYLRRRAVPAPPHDRSPRNLLSGKRPRVDFQSV